MIVLTPLLLLFLFLYLYEIDSKSILISEIPNGKVFSLTDEGNLQIQDIATHSWENAKVPDGHWKAITSDYKNSKMFMASSNNGLVVSKNGGDTWENTEFGRDLSWEDVTCDNSGKYVLAVAQNSPIFRSVDNGNSWRPSSSPSNGWKSIVSDSTGQYAFAAAPKDGIYASMNFAEHWIKSCDTPANWIDVAVSENGQFIAAVSEDAGIYYSQYFGFTWERSEAPNLKWKSIVSEKSGQYFLALSSNGEVYFSDNFAASFHVLPSLQKLKCESIAVDGFTHETFIIALQSNYNLLYSKDKGVSWEELQASTKSLETPFGPLFTGYSDFKPKIKLDNYRNMISENVILTESRKFAFLPMYSFDFLFFIIFIVFEASKLNDFRYVPATITDSPTEAPTEQPSSSPSLHSTKKPINTHFPSSSPSSAPSHSQYSTTIRFNVTQVRIRTISPFEQSLIINL
jgi:photosystem II stability/assembly factor-like uncharacterized protein